MTNEKTTATVRNTTEIEQAMTENVNAYNRYYELVQAKKEPLDENGEKLDLVAILKNRVKLNSEYTAAAQRELFEKIAITSKNGLAKNPHFAMLEFVRNSTFKTKAIKDKKADEEGRIVCDITEKPVTASLPQFVAYGTESKTPFVAPDSEWAKTTDALFYSAILGISKKVGANIDDYLIDDNGKKTAKTADLTLLKSIISDLLGDIFAEKVTAKDVEFIKNCATRGGRRVSDLEAIKGTALYQRILGVCITAVTGKNHGITGYKAKK